MIAAHQPLPRSSLALAGLTAALALRLVVAGDAGASSVLAGILFAVALLIVATVFGWRPNRLRLSSLAIGVLGALALVAVPAVLRLTSPSPVVVFPTGAWPLWAGIVSMVAIAEELLLRGSLFTLIERARGPYAAVAVTSIAFALLHVPLYGWGVLPLDLAVGVWLGGLRLISGSVAAPAVAHVLADLAAWWLI